MTRYKHLTALVLCLLCLAALLPVSAGAQTYDTDEPLSLTVSYQDDGKPVVGALFRLYKIAELNDDLSLTADPTFADFKSSIEAPDTRWDVLADGLETFVDEEQITADDKAKTNAAGKANFPSSTKALNPGVYLLISARYRYDGRIYDPSPVIITLPNRDGAGNWVYDVNAHAKFTPDVDAPVDIIVIKKWSDKGYEDKRPKEISVILLRDGKEFDRKKLSRGNDWTCVWPDLDPIYKWEIREVKVDGYDPEMKLEKDGNVWTVTITNRYDPPKPPKLPQTGQLNWPIPVLLATGAVLFCLGCFLRFGRRKDDYAK